jgi:hypothetical protein
MTPELKKLGNKLFLGTHKVELATLYDNITKTLDDANKEFFDALELKNKAAKLADVSYKKNVQLLKEIEKVESLIKQIGLDSELKKVQDSKQKVQDALRIIDKAITVLLSV